MVVHRWPVPTKLPIAAVQEQFSLIQPNHSKFHFINIATLLFYTQYITFNGHKGLIETINFKVLSIFMEEWRVGTQGSRWCLQPAHQALAVETRKVGPYSHCPEGSSENIHYKSREIPLDGTYQE